MKYSNDTFVNVPHCVNENDIFFGNNNLNNGISIEDPLAGTEKELSEPKFFRVNDVVFAEPINIDNNDTSECVKSKNSDQAEEILFVDNVVVKKRNGKRNKYLFHIEDTKNPTCPQPNCTRSFSTATLLKAHIRKVHCATQRYTCERCARSFTAPYLLARHMTCHGERRQCVVCRQMLSARTDMATHLRTHSNTRPHACATCGKRFVRKATLNTHVKFVHRVGGIKCDECGERFATRKQFSNHRSCQAKQ